MCKKDHRYFWKEVKHHTNIKVTLHTNNEGVHGDVIIKVTLHTNNEGVHGDVNIKVTLHTNNEGVHDDVNIRSMWKYHYENIFSSVKDSRCNKVNFDCVTYNSGKTIDAGE